MSGLILSPEHPAQLCWGFLVEVREQAIRSNQAVFKFLADVARPDVLEVRELFREIANDTIECEQIVAEVAADGVITFDEVGRVKGKLRVTRIEAQEGRIL